MKRSYIRRKPARNAPTAEDKAYWDRLPRRCQACGGRESVVHHLLSEAPGKAKRRDHRFVVKLCPLDHNMGDSSVHALGSERSFLEVWGVDLVAIAVKNREDYGG